MRQIHSPACLFIVPDFICDFHVDLWRTHLSHIGALNTVGGAPQIRHMRMVHICNL